MKYILQSNSLIPNPYPYGSEGEAVHQEQDAARQAGGAALWGRNENLYLKILHRAKGIHQKHSQKGFAQIYFVLLQIYFKGGFKYYLKFEQSSLVNFF